MKKTNKNPSLKKKKPKKTKNKQKTCTPMFIEASLIVSRTWKQPRCPSTDEWIKKMYYMCTLMFIAALFLIARTWKQPRCPSADEWIRKLYNGIIVQ